MLNVRELEFASCVEQEYLLHGGIPSYDKINTLMRITRAFYERCLKMDEVQEHLENLGVPIKSLLGDLPRGALSVEQLRCINTLLDFNDTRSDRKKLESLGVKSSTYQAWKSDPAFQSYIQQRANKLFGNNLDEVDRALLDNARSGDISSIKLIYELTGKYNPRADGQIDAKALITQILEIIILEVQDPETIKRISSKLQLLAVGGKLKQEPSFLDTNVIDTVALGELSA